MSNQPTTPCEPVAALAPTARVARGFCVAARLVAAATTRLTTPTLTGELAGLRAEVARLEAALALARAQLATAWASGYGPGGRPQDGPLEGDARPRWHHCGPKDPGRPTLWFGMPPPGTPPVVAGEQRAAHEAGECGCEPKAGAR